MRVGGAGRQSGRQVAWAGAGNRQVVTFGAAECPCASGIGVCSRG